MGISLHRVLMGNLEGGCFTGNFERYAQKALVVSIRAPMGNLEGGGGFFAEVFERQVEEGSGNGAFVSTGL
jgi:hypothetical protein